jgi:thiamine biosynthesis lipoprotein
MLGTLVEISVAAADEASAERAVELAFAEIETVHGLMSFHEPQSDVSRLNREAVHTPLTVDARTWEVLAAAHDIASRTDGLFDVTVAPVLVEWEHLPGVPGGATADVSASWRDIEMLDGCRVRFLRPLVIDLGGIAKGYAVDRAIAAIHASEVQTARVNAGGDLRLFGAAPEPLHIRHPLQPSALIEAGSLHNEAAATSAGTHGERAPHVHPGTRRPCDALASVTVRAPTCIVADALTKVALCDPPGAPVRLARFGASALAVDRAGTVRSTAW